MIRPYISSDKEQLLNIFSLNILEFFDKKELNDFEEYLGQKAETYLTFVADTTIVGGTGYYINEKDKSGRITWIFFDPRYAGQGFGRQSVEYCLKLLSKDIRVEKFIVTTSQLAYKFFEKFDYITTRIEKHYWGEGLDLYEMEKPNK